MIDLNDIVSLTEFQRNSRLHLQRLRKSGRPMVLTVNGRAAAVIRDAEHYQQLVDEVEESRLAASLRRGVESVKRGGGRPFDEVYSEIRARHIDDKGHARKSRRKAS